MFKKNLYKSNNNNKSKTKKPTVSFIIYMHPLLLLYGNPYFHISPMGGCWWQERPPEILTPHPDTRFLISPHGRLHEMRMALLYEKKGVTGNTITSRRSPRA